MTQAPTASDHINRYIDHRGLGLRSKAGVPLDGEQAFSEGCAFEHNPWRAPGLYNHLRDQWSQEWQFAQRHSARARTETQAPATPELVERLRDNTWRFEEEVSDTLVRWQGEREEAADALEAQQARIAELEAELADVAIPSPYCEICGSCGSEGCGCEHKCKYAHSHPDVVRDMDALQALADRYETALRDLIEHFEGDQEHDEGAFDEGCPDCLALQFARQALSSQGRREWGEDGLPELPCGVGPSDLTDPQSQHSDGGAK